MWDDMFKSVNLLQKGLSAAWTRNTVIRNNLANIETPGFKASDVQFETLMAQAIEKSERSDYNGTKTHPNHIGGGEGFVAATTHEKHYNFGAAADKDIDPLSVNARVIRREGTSMRMDGNNVDVEVENVKLAQNSIYYDALLAKVNSELRRMSLAINEGR